MYKNNLIDLKNLSSLISTMQSTYKSETLCFQ